MQIHRTNYNATSSLLVIIYIPRPKCNAKSYTTNLHKFLCCFIALNFQITSSSDFTTHYEIMEYFKGCAPKYGQLQKNNSLFKISHFMEIRHILAWIKHTGESVRL